MECLPAARIILTNWLSCHLAHDTGARLGEGVITRLSISRQPSATDNGNNREPWGLPLRGLKMNGGPWRYCDSLPKFSDHRVSDVTGLRRLTGRTRPPPPSASKVSSASAQTFIISSVIDYTSA
jgi:hypothetical protein